jgi:hypothetical protein
MIVMFEPGYVEKYHSFLLAKRILSDALTALLLVKAGRRDHPKIGNALQELRKAVRELIESKDAPTGRVSSTLLQVLSREEVDELVRGLNWLIRIFEGENLDGEAYKHLANHLIDKAGRLDKAGLELEKKVLLGLPDL